LPSDYYLCDVRKDESVAYIKAPQTPLCGNPVGKGSSKYTAFKFVVGSFILNSFF
jgi:hypothetical protein